MKSKILSVLMLVLAVSLFGVSAQAAVSVTDHGKQIEKAAQPMADLPAIDLQLHVSQLKSVPQYTAMEVCCVHQSFEGDIDHQLIVIRAGESITADFAGYIPYRPRSNLNYLDYFA